MGQPSGTSEAKFFQNNIVRNYFYFKVYYIIYYKHISVPKVKHRLEGNSAHCLNVTQFLMFPNHHKNFLFYLPLQAWKQNILLSEGVNTGKQR